MRIAGEVHAALRQAAEQEPALQGAANAVQLAAVGLIDLQEVCWAERCRRSRPCTTWVMPGPQVSTQRRLVLDLSQAWYEYACWPCISHLAPCPALQLSGSGGQVSGTAAQELKEALLFRGLDSMQAQVRLTLPAR